jgi:hypothetical protein
VFGFAAELTVRRGIPVFFAGDRVQAQLLAGKLLAFYAAG